MTNMGENGLDLNLDDLTFDLEDLNIGEEEIEGAGQEGPQGTGDGEDASEGSEEGGGEAVQETEDNDTITEGDDPENVSEGSAEEEDEQSSPQLYSTLASTLVEQGVLTSVDESSLKDIKSVDEFVEVMKSQIKAQEFADLTDTQKEILTGIREGASEDTVSRFKNAMTQLDAISNEMIESNEAVQKDLVYQDYLSKGFSKEKASMMVDRIAKLGVLKDDAAEAHTNLKKLVKERYDASKAADIENASKEDLKAEQDAEKLRKAILEANKIMDVEVPEVTRKEVYAEMMKHVSINPVTKKPENALMKYQRENPTEFSQKLYYLWKATNGFQNTEHFGNKKASRTVKDLERAIKQSTHVAGGGDPSYSDDINTSLLDIDDIVLPGE